MQSIGAGALAVYSACRALPDAAAGASAMKILLAIDESPFSEAATRAVIAQWKPQETEVEVLHVVETVYTAVYIPPLEDQIAHARELTEKAAQALRAAGFQAHTTTGAGDPRAVILQAAEEWKPDLIVMGSHGRKGVNRFLMGSVSEAVAQHAKCSVEVVRPPLS
jgi:nucleotide-binding universal stress UspA family protein